MQAQFHLHHRSSPGISQDWPLVIQFSAQMALAGYGERREYVRDLSRFHVWLMGWTVVLPTNSKDLEGRFIRSRREMINSVLVESGIPSRNIQHTTEYIVLELRQVWQRTSVCRLSKPGRSMRSPHKEGRE